MSAGQRQCTCDFDGRPGCVCSQNEKQTLDRGGQTIYVRKRSDDWHASLVDSRFWGCGKTPREAIGDLVQYHAEQFGIEIGVAHQENS